LDGAGFGRVGLCGRCGPLPYDPADLLL
jgi:hypothetical protein